MIRTNKKVLLSLSVLATPFVAENLVKQNVAEANNTYNLTQSVNVYSNAQNAAKQKNSSKTYASGTYYVYKEHNGMINISRTKGKPGAWINPATNKVVETPVTKEPVVVVTTKVTSVPKQEVQKTVSAPAQVTSVATQLPKQEVQPKSTEQKVVESTTTQAPKQLDKSNTYTLNNNVQTYSNASAAKTQKGSKSTYSSGTYFIYKEFNGMMNISRVAGRAGAWINPLENKVVQAKVETKHTTAQKPAEIKEVTPEKKEEQAKVEVTPAKEQKTTETKVEDKKAPEQKSSVEKTSLKQGDAYILKHTANTYSNAVDASKTSNSRNTYGQGTYYIYKTHNGMINISRTRGKSGAWINPNEKEEVLTVLPFASKTYRITSPYGVARNIASIGVRDIHNGVDFVTNNNKESILSTEDGVVTGSGYWPYDGSQYVTIKHSDNSYTSYWHLALNSITVKAGDKVKAGQKIGTIGSTGPSTGIHLHFMHSTTKEWWKTHQDPIKYLRNLSKK